MDYIYPAIFLENDDGSYTVTFPDLPGCISEGRSLASAMDMAQSALSQWIEFLQSEKKAVPKALGIADVAAGENEFVSLIRVNIRDDRAVKRTISLPKWMDDKVSEEGWSLSRVLQDALAQKLQ